MATTTTPANVDALCRATLGAPAAAVFEVIAAGDAVEAKKPAPDVYLLALAGLGLDSAGCVAVEDSLNGLVAAKAAGLFTVVTPSRFSAGEDLAAADLMLPSLAGLLAEPALRRSPIRQSRLVRLESWIAAILKPSAGSGRLEIAQSAVTTYSANIVRCSGKKLSSESSSTRVRPSGSCQTAMPSMLSSSPKRVSSSVVSSSKPSGPSSKRRTRVRKPPSHSKSRSSR